MFIMVSVFAGNTLKSILSSYPQKIKTALKELPRQIVRGMEYELYNASEIEVSLARQEKIKKNLRIVVHQLKPFADEIKPLFFDRDLKPGEQKGLPE